MGNQNISVFVYVGEHIELLRLSRADPGMLKCQNTKQFNLQKKNDYFTYMYIKYLKQINTFNVYL